MGTGRCLDDEQVMGLVEGHLSGSSLEAALQHLEACEACQALAGAVAPDNDEPQAVVVGQRVGRYTVQAELGAGAMGVVYRAWDPSLDRPVALKLLNPAKSQSQSARLRIVREAKALAQFSHPNVLHIYDVGQFGESTFIAMEFVEGETLRSWWEGKSTSELLPVLLAAGRGLARAHRKGLVHRDFKPANVLVGTDGRPRIADFGLVGVESSVDSTSDELPAADETLNITRAGSIVGTPRYMAPEQLAGGQAMALSDQFSFCVVLYEALYGHRPFQGKSLIELRAAIARGPTPPRCGGIEGRLFSAIARGLHEDPTCRHPNTDDLLDALESRARRRHRRPVLLVGGLVTASLLATTAFSEPPQTCPQHEDAQQLSNQLRASVEALDRTDPRIARVVERRLDDYANRWSETVTTACKIEEQTARVAALGCLDVRRVEAETTASFIASGDHAADLARGQLEELAAPVTCLSPDASDQTSSVLPGMDARLPAAHALLSEVQMHYNIGSRDEALRLLDGGHALLDASGSPAILARAQLLRGVLTVATGRFEEGAQEIEQAYWTALRYRLDDLAHSAALRLIMTHAERLDDRDAAAVWAERARALSPRVGVEGRAHYHREIARMALSARDLELALDSALQAERSLEFAVAASELDRLSIQTMLGRIYSTRGEHQSASVRYAAALDGYVRLYGERHPNVAGTRLGLAYSAIASGNIDEAELLAELVLEQLHGGKPVEDMALTSALDVLASVEERRGNFESALALRRRVIEAREDGAGDSARRLRSALRSASITLEFAGRHEEALQLRERVLVLTESADGPESYDAALSHNNIGASLLALGRHEDARRHFLRSIRLLNRSDGNANQVRYPLSGLGEVVLASGQPLKARRWLERALVVSKDADDTMLTAQVQATLARALWGIEDEERALRLADEAERALALDPRYADQHEALVRWRETL